MIRVTYADGWVYIRVSRYTPLWNQFAIEVDTLAKRFSNIPLWCSVRFYRACRLLWTQDENYTRSRVWEAWLKAASHETINKKKITSDCWWRIHEARKKSGSKDSIGGNYLERFGPRFYDGVPRRCAVHHSRAILGKLRQAPRGEKPHYLWHVKNLDEERRWLFPMRCRKPEIGSAGASWIFTRARMSFYAVHSAFGCKVSQQWRGAIAADYSCVNPE